jgi:SOS response regulatory protein OraA/RecX
VLDAAARLLEVRPRATGELRRRLRAAGYPHTLVEEAITRLTAVGYLDDEAFARAWVESRDRSRPRGEAALRRELATHGVAAETIDAVLTQRAVGAGAGVGRSGRAHEPRAGDTTGDHRPDEAAARRLLERRGAALLREPDPRRRRQKAYALLARAGFDPDTCRDVALGWLNETAEE